MEDKSLPSSGSNEVDSLATSERKRKSRTSDSSDVASKYHVVSSLKQVRSPQQTSGGGNANQLSACEDSAMSEKLWDGTLQLNSSVGVSAVAFFKSGERLLDVSWSKFVEVKGKVKLDAFEKYILDLPHSRSRGLMIISICAKEGSSEKGLKGLKEVTKGYINGERVGLAQLSPGVDVYLCPQYDKIFSILAKYGSFEGMGATEEKLKSLIGCVVWRKSQNTADQNDRGGERIMSSSAMATQNSISSSIRPSSSGVQSKNSSVRKVEIGRSSAATMCATSVPAKSTIAVEQQEYGRFNLSSQTASRGNHLGSEVASIRNSLSEKTRASLELPNKFISVPSDVAKQKMPATEDDDLPEYDFGTACGTSFASAGMPLDVHTPDSRRRTERTTNVDGHMLSYLPVRHSSYASIQGMPLSRVTSGHDPRIHVPGRLEDEYDFQRYATPAAVGAVPLASIPSNNFQKRKLFFDNDDDMPEWLPPQQQRPLFPAPVRSQFPPELLHQPSRQSTTCRPPPSLPIQNSSSFLTGFGSNRGLRPPSGYPLRPADGRYRRP